MLSYGKIFSVQFLNFLNHGINQRFTELHQPIRLIFYILQLVNNLEHQIEDSPLHSHPGYSLFSFSHTEKFKIAAKIEYIKLTLIFSINKSRTASSTTANHLPKLGLTHNLLEEDQIQNFRHIDSSVQHINGYSNLRHFLAVRKFINSTLTICHVIINDLGKGLSIIILGKMWIFLIEYF